MGELCGSFRELILDTLARGAGRGDTHPAEVNLLRRVQLVALTLCYDAAGAVCRNQSILVRRAHIGWP